ncbi:MAG TPA: N-acetyltransferase [bacterium]|nr:N-acetyltransferase [bacterium]
MNPRIHPTAIVEDGVEIADGTAIWDAVHVRHGAHIGRDCIIGEKTYIAYDVRIGDLCKLNASVYVCAGVELERGVMVAAHTVFTNDVTPRAADPDLRALRPSEPDESTRRTIVRRGATIGANCTIGPGVELGPFCMIGMGSVVTRDVPAHALVLGNPARLAGVVCSCGAVLARATGSAVPPGEHRCACGRSVHWPGSQFA